MRQGLLIACLTFKSIFHISSESSLGFSVLWYRNTTQLSLYISIQSFTNGALCMMSSRFLMQSVRGVGSEVSSRLKAGTHWNVISVMIPIKPRLTCRNGEKMSSMCMYVHTLYPLSLSLSIYLSPPPPPHPPTHPPSLSFSFSLPSLFYTLIFNAS